MYDWVEAKVGSGGDKCAEQERLRESLLEVKTN
jgi:hypothetical protein